MMLRGSHWDAEKEDALKMLKGPRMDENTDQDCQGHETKGKGGFRFLLDL